MAWTAKRAKRIAALIRGEDPDKIQVGDRVKITGGPYTKTKKGERKKITKSGLYQIEKIVDNGFMVKLVKNLNLPHAPIFIYMGEDYKTELGTYMTKHKVIKQW